MASPPEATLNATPAILERTPISLVESTMGSVASENAAALLAASTLESGVDAEARGDVGIH